MCLGLGIVTVALQPTPTNIFDMETALPNSDGTHKEQWEHCTSQTNECHDVLNATMRS